MTFPGRTGAIAKTLLFTVLVPGAVTIYAPRRILLSRSGNDALPIGPLRYLGAALLAAGAAVYLWCAWDFATAGRGTPAPIDPPRSLVERGLYRHVRNPMYLGILLLLGGEAVLFRSRALLAYAGLVFLFFFLFVVAYEEPALRSKFGQVYERYCDRVPRWIPRFHADRLGSIGGAMKRVTGIGGIFFKAQNPEKLRAWYETHLGMPIESWGGMQFHWRRDDDPQTRGHTVWSLFKADTRYFDPSEKPFMINYRVENLAEVLAALKSEGVTGDEKIEDSEYGRFAWVMDPEGNRIELWEPPKEKK